MKNFSRKTGNTSLVLGAAMAAMFAPVIMGQVYSQNYGGQPGYSDQQSVDPPSRVARVSVVVGNVSIEPASVQQFNVAETNYPMTTGDRIYADSGSNAEIQTGQIAVRTGQQTDLTVTSMTDELAQFGLAQGSVHLRSYNVYQGEAVELDTPNVAVTVLQAGDVRVDVDANNDVTYVRVLNGQVQVNGNGVEQVLEPGERMSFQGSNPVYAQQLGGVRPDALDRFSAQRDSLYLSAYAANGGYVNPGTIGGEDLNANGTWEEDGDYGAVWYPTNVDAGWQPYRNGHWTWVAPWGWTWIEAEPWGFAPFHYGRWNRFGNRWGWIPGPVVVHPVYSPALVAFVGGAQFAIGGVGVTAWFPLGPREAYHPWYHASPVYVNRVNVTNIYDRNVTEVRNIYNQRTVVNMYANDNHSYANRQLATVAVSHDNFTTGRRADQTMMRVSPQQMAGAQILPHPMVSPQRQMVAATPSRAVPPMQARPVLASHEDTAVRPSFGLHPQGGPQQPGQQDRFQQQPQNQPQQPNQQQGQQGRFQQQQQPQQNQTQQSNQQQGQQQRPQQPNQTQQPVQQQPVQQQRFQPGQGSPGQPHNEMYNPHQVIEQPQQPRTTVQPQVPVQQRPQNLPQQTPVQQAPVQQQQRVPQQAPVQQTPVQQQPQRVQPQTPTQPVQQPQQQQQQRPLFNKAVPPEPRPGFDQQRQAIEQNDPGRPLSPQQLNNLKQNQPAGPPQQKESAHPEPQTPRGGPQKAPGQPNK